MRRSAGRYVSGSRLGDSSGRRLAADRHAFITGGPARVTRLSVTESARWSAHAICPNFTCRSPGIHTEVLKEGHAFLLPSATMIFELRMSESKELLTNGFQWRKRIVNHRNYNLRRNYTKQSCAFDTRMSATEEKKRSSRFTGRLGY